MKRVLCVLSLLLVAVPATAQARTRASGLAGVAVTACQHALDPAARSATFEGHMRTVSHATKLQMKFTLQTRAGKASWRLLKADGFGVWFTSKPKVLGYVYDKQVANLAAPADYRTRVHFRWRDSHGKTLRVQRVTSGVCHQPDLRPDLVVSRIEVAAAKDPAQARYTVTVANKGRSGASAPFDLGLSLNTGQQPSMQVAGLAAHQSRSFVFTAPRCSAGDTITATVDPGAAVDEAAEANNTRTRTCPSLPRR